MEATTRHRTVGETISEQFERPGRNNKSVRRVSASETGRGITHVHGAETAGSRVQWNGCQNETRSRWPQTPTLTPVHSPEKILALTARNCSLTLGLRAFTVGTVYPDVPGKFYDRSCRCRRLEVEKSTRTIVSGK